MEMAPARKWPRGAAPAAARAAPATATATATAAPSCGAARAAPLCRLHPRGAGAATAALRQRP